MLLMEKDNCITVGFFPLSSLAHFEGFLTLFFLKRKAIYHSFNLIKKNLI